MGVGALFTQGCDGLRAGSTGRTRSPPAQPAWTDTLARGSSAREGT